ncbi:MAG: beta-galactosidase [Acutalibacter sp.]|nr:beta-galactosidase [Acutalibacter sp.]
MSFERSNPMTSLTPKFPHLLHGGDYNPDQWLDRPDILEQDIALMKEAHINCVSLGIFAWAKLEPQEGMYQLDWLEQIIQTLYENGVYTVLATPSGAKPRWMSEKYPEIRRVTAAGQRELSGGRHNHCYTSPVYREKVRAVNTVLAQRFAKHPGVILWHLSNEYGGECRCELCQAAFREWLKKKYGSLEALNKQWWTDFWSQTFNSWEEIHAPAPRGPWGNAEPVHGLSLDWKRFVTDQVADFIAAEGNAVKAADPSIPVTANLMYDFYYYNYFKFKDLLDVVSWDAYPQWKGTGEDIATAADFALWHDVMRSLKKQPFLLMESTPSVINWGPVSRLKRPGMHLASSMQAVGHGADSVQYFQFRKSRGATEKFHGAVVDHCGHSGTREFRDVEQVGRRLQQLDEAICGSQVKPEVALVFDTENRWAVETAAGPRNCGIHYAEDVRAHYRALWRMGVPVDIVDEECGIGGYKLVIAPMLYLLRAGFAEKLRAFVEAGGVLVGTYHTGLVNENDLCHLGGWPGEGLGEVFGLWHEATDGLWDGESNCILLDGKSYPVTELCALIHAKGAQVLGTYGRDFYQGEPALTVNAYGAGQAYYLAARAGADFYRDFYSGLTEKLACKRALPAPPPEGVEACLREKNGESYVFLQNFSGEAQSVPLPEGCVDMASGQAIATAELAAYDSVVIKRG